MSKPVTPTPPDFLELRRPIMRAYTAFNGHPEGWPIAWATAPWRDVLRGDVSQIPTHARIGWEFVEGDCWYCEALMGNGWSGPRRERDCEAWVAGGPGRWTRRYWLPTLPDASWRMWSEAKSHLAYGAGVRWSYPVLQLWQMLLYRLWRKPVKDSPGEVVCSEGCIRVAEAAPVIELTAARRRLYPRATAEEITPYQLEQAVRAVAVGAAW